MGNPFKKIAKPPQEVPKTLKNKVMAEVARTRLLMEMADLFSSKYTLAAKSFFEKKRKE